MPHETVIKREKKESRKEGSLEPDSIPGEMRMELAARHQRPHRNKFPQDTTLGDSLCSHLPLQLGSGETHVEK